MDATQAQTLKVGMTIEENGQKYTVVSVYKNQYGTVQEYCLRKWGQRKDREKYDWLMDL
jgi:translation elongation factor P/translation initiation factor 5A